MPRNPNTATFFPQIIILTLPLKFNETKNTQLTHIHNGTLFHTLFPPSPRPNTAPTPPLARPPPTLYRLLHIHAPVGMCAMGRAGEEERLACVLPSNLLESIEKKYQLVSTTKPPPPPFPPFPLSHIRPTLHKRHTIQTHAQPARLQAMSDTRARCWACLVAVQVDPWLSPWFFFHFV